MHLITLPTHLRWLKVVNKTQLHLSRARGLGDKVDKSVEDLFSLNHIL